MRTILLLLFIAILPASALAEIVIIVNANNKLKKIELSNLQDIYMGKMQAFADESMALPIDQAKLRVEFYEKLTQRPIEQINAYWARIMFSGEASPPRIMSDDASVISTVKENPGAIGYVSKESVSKGVKTLLILK
jgi:ABC-type phosphate transport system substrate-binding protein